nr:YigZ family protein [uncultured Mogibacterium sp.]
MKLYDTIYEEATAEYIIQKSRFIAHIAPVDTYDEAKTFIASIKAKYKDATHNVPVLVVGEKQEMQWSSEDGEPQGTAGAPVLRMLVDSGLTNLAIVVTRYFGGIKLGTGGLMRAYTAAARLAIDKARLCEVKEAVILKYEISYSDMTKIENISKTGVFNIAKIEYTDKITLEINGDIDRKDEIMDAITDITAGRCRLLKKESRKNKFVIDSATMLC